MGVDDAAMNGDVGLAGERVFPCALGRVEGISKRSGSGTDQTATQSRGGVWLTNNGQTTRRGHVIQNRYSRFASSAIHLCWLKRANDPEKKLDVLCAGNYAL